MAGVALEKILGYQALLGVVQTTVSGIKNPLPDSFMRATEKVIGDAGMLTQIKGERRLASTNVYGSPAKMRGLKEISRLPVKLISSFEGQPLDPTVLHQLMSLDKYEQDKGASFIAMQTKAFAKLQQNLRIASAIMMLAQGVIYRDADGVVLPTSSGESAPLRISSGIDAAHQGQGNNGTASIITASWATPTTNIAEQLLNLQERSGQETGYRLTNAFYGKRVANYLINNDFAIEFMSRNPSINDSWVKNNGLIPQGLWGLNWIPMYDAFFRNAADDTSYSLWDPDLVVFTPDIDGNGDMGQWWSCVEGTTMVPTTVDIVNTQSSLENCRMEYGMGSYGQLSHNPIGIINYQFDVFLHYIRAPGVIWQLDVVP